MECSHGVREVMGLIPGQVIPKTSKIIPDASLLSAWHLKVRSRKYGRFPQVGCYISVPAIYYLGAATPYLSFAILLL